MKTAQDSMPRTPLDASDQLHDHLLVGCGSYRHPDQLKVPHLNSLQQLSNSCQRLAMQLPSHHKAAPPSESESVSSIFK